MNTGLTPVTPMNPDPLNLGLQLGLYMQVGLIIDRDRVLRNFEDSYKVLRGIPVGGNCGCN
jgi:hypothetical protein